MPKLKVTLSIGYHGASHDDIIDIDEEEWEDCETEVERTELMDSYWQDWANNYIEGGCLIVED